MSLSLQFDETTIIKQFSSTQGRNEQNPSPSAHEITTVPSWKTPTRCETNITNLKTDPEVNNKLSDLYAKAKEFDFGKPISDKKINWKKPTETT